MKGNIRKLAVLGIISIIVPFILGACATTTPPAPHALQGKYVGAGVSTCLFAVCGFGNNNVPNIPEGPNKGWGSGAWSLSTNSHQIVMTLEPDGTGTVSEDIRSVTFNNTSPTVPWPSTGEMTDTHNISYMVAPDGTFTLRDVPGTFKSQGVSGAMKGQAFVLKDFFNTGHISPDGKVITMFDTGAPKTFIPPMHICPVPTEPKPEAAEVCNATFTLFKQ